MSKVAIADQIACAERELQLRQNTYPRWVAAKRITDGHARIETHRMAAVVDTLRWLEANYDDIVAFVAERKLGREPARRAEAPGVDDHPAVVAVREAFPGAEVVGMRDLFPADSE